MEMKTKLMIAFAACLVAAVIVLGYLPMGGREPVIVESDSADKTATRAARPARQVPKPALQERVSERPLASRRELASHAPDSMPKRLERLPTLETSKSGAIRQTGPGSASGYSRPFPSGRSGSASGSGYSRRERPSSGVRDVRGDVQRYTPSGRRDRGVFSTETSYAPGVVVVGNRIYADETEYRAEMRQRSAGVRGDIQASYQRWRAEKDREEMLLKQLEDRPGQEREKQGP